MRIKLGQSRIHAKARWRHKLLRRWAARRGQKICAGGVSTPPATWELVYLRSILSPGDNIGRDCQRSGV